MSSPLPSVLPCGCPLGHTRLRMIALVVHRFRFWRGFAKTDTMCTCRGWDAKYKFGILPVRMPRFKSTARPVKIMLAG